MGLLGFAGCLIGFGQNLEDLPEPHSVTVPQLTANLSLDGALSEPAWARAASLRNFWLNDGRGPGLEATRVKLFYDDEALYLGWVCEDSDIQATLTERDSRFWEEEVVEFFVTTGPLNKYFELQWNPLGAVFDAIIENRLDGNGRSVRFEGDWRYTASRMRSGVSVIGTVQRSGDRDQRWVVEAKVPFRDLETSMPQPGTVWRGNFYRFNRTTGSPVQMLSWSPTCLKGFHQPSRFGYLRFVGKEKEE